MYKILPRQSNPFSSVNFLPTETDHFFAPNRSATCSGALSAHSRVSSHSRQVPLAVCPPPANPKTELPRQPWSAPNGGRGELWCCLHQHRAYRHCRRRRCCLTVPKINLISCHNCSGNVASGELIPTEDFSKKTGGKESGTFLSRLYPSVKWISSQNKKKKKNNM